MCQCSFDEVMCRCSFDEVSVLSERGRLMRCMQRSSADLARFASCVNVASVRVSVCAGDRVRYVLSTSNRLMRFV